MCHCKEVWFSMMMKRTTCMMWMMTVMMMSGILTAAAQPKETIHEPEEYCQSKNFQPSCNQNEAIIMLSAKYGRIRTGKCLSDDFGFLDCEYDVMPEMDAYCSGKRSCEVKVDDSSFPSIRPCHKELKSFLLASYKCVQVQPITESCKETELFISGSQEGYISSVIHEQHTCGDNNLRPWIIEMDPGQKVNVTLLDFSRNATQENRRDAYPPVCKVYATIREDGDTRRTPTTVCGYLGRITPVYLSATNKIEVRLMSSQTTSNKAQARYLLHYKASGCADPVESPDMVVHRAGDVADITCTNTGNTWRVTCKHDQWQGTAPSNCTQQGIVLATTDEEFSPLPYALSIAIIVAIALIVSCVIFVVGVVCIRKRIHRGVPRPRRDAESEVPDYYDVPPLKDPYPKVPVSPPGSGTPGRENEYATMRLLRSACFNRQSRESPAHQPSDCCTISSTYDPRRTGLSEHTYESPEVIRREGGLLEGTTSPQYFDLMKKNTSTFAERGPVSPQYFDLDLPTSFPLEVTAHAHGHVDSEGGGRQCARHASIGPDSDRSANGQPNKYSL